MELVSVIIPTYKRANMLPRAIDSVLNQSYNAVQVVVVDDNDPNSIYRETTKKLMEQYSKDSRVKYIMHKKNMNGAVARNTGIAHSDGEIITFLDDDDFYYKDKIMLQVNYLHAHPEYRAVYCGWKRKNIRWIPTAEGDLSYNYLSGDEVIYTNAIMMWKQDAQICGGWDETFQRHQEAAFMLRFFRNGGLTGVVSKVLFEFDLSDRSNDPDARRNEVQTLYYLEAYKDVIKNCAKSNKYIEKKIYSHRYIGIFLNYILQHDFRGAFCFYLKCWKKMPVVFHYEMLCYISRRVQGKNIKQ